MTFAELYAALIPLVPHGRIWELSVKAWNPSDWCDGLRWHLYIASEPHGTFVNAETPELLIDRAREVIATLPPPPPPPPPKVHETIAAAGEMALPPEVVPPSVAEASTGEESPF